MKTRLADRDVHVAVISANRPHHVADFPVPATWHVPADQAEDYRRAGAPAVALGSTAGPGAARNAALDHAHALGLDALILDDDPHGGVRHWTPEGGKGKTLPISHHRALEIVVARTVEAGASLGSTGYFLNATYIKSAVTSWGGGCYGWVTYVPAGTPGAHLRQDEQLPWAEDFDFAIQHAVGGSGFARVDEVLWKCRTDGGVSDAVGSEGQRAAGATLVERWRAQVKVNPKGWLLMGVAPQPPVVLPALADRVVPVYSLKPYPGNARLHDLDVIADSLAANGQFRPIIANRRTGHILKGNGTFTAATTRLGWTGIAVSWVDVPVEDEARLVLVDNRASELGWFNDAALAGLLRDMGDLTGTGYDDAALADLEKSLGGPLLPPAPKDKGEAVDKAKKKYDTAEMRMLVLVADDERYAQLQADLTALRLPDETTADVVRRLIEMAEPAA